MGLHLYGFEIFFLFFVIMLFNLLYLSCPCLLIVNLSNIFKGVYFLVGGVFFWGSARWLGYVLL